MGSGTAVAREASDMVLQVRATFLALVWACTVVYCTLRGEFYREKDKRRRARWPYHPQWLRFDNFSPLSLLQVEPLASLRNYELRALRGLVALCLHLFSPSLHVVSLHDMAVALCLDMSSVLSWQWNVCRTREPDVALQKLFREMADIKAKIVEIIRNLYFWWLKNKDLHTHTYTHTAVTASIFKDHPCRHHCHPSPLVITVITVTTCTVTLHCCRR
jgi:hypothetical protein